MSLETRPAPPATPNAPPQPAESAADDGGDDDGDEVALTDHDEDGAEPEARKVGRQDDPGFDGDGATVSRKRRVYSDKTRELFKGIASKVKAARDAGELGDNLVPAIGLEGEEADDEGDPAGEAPAPGQAAAKPPVPPAAPPAPQAPPAGPDPRTVAEWEKINIARAQLAAEEKRIAAAHAANRGNWPDRYVEDAAGVIRDLIKEATGAADDEAIRDEIGDLITELSTSVLGLTLAPEVRSRLDSRKALRTVKAHKSQLTKQEQQLARKQEEAKQLDAERGAVDALGKALKHPEVSKAYPWLSCEANAGEIVFDVLKRHKETTGVELPWEEGAKFAEDYLKKQGDGFYAARRHLFAEAPAPKPATPPPNGSEPQGDPSSIRRSRTLRNGHASAPNGTPPTNGDGRFDNEAHRKQTLGKFRASLKPAE